VTTKQAALPSWLTAEDRLRLYTPEEVIEMGFLPFTVRTLKEAAYAKRVPHTKLNGKIRFRLDHIWAISTAGDVNPATSGRRAA
jgi:hypothetical protein